MCRPPAATRDPALTRRPILWLSLALSLAPVTGRGQIRPGREVRLVMGTTAELRATGLDDPGPALDRAFAALTLVDDQMSLWKESDLSRLNEAGSAVVPPELFAVVREALEVAAASDGAFDPTVEPLVRAAGGMGGPHRTLRDAERRELLRRVGAARVHLDGSARTIRLDGGARLDLGGIAKGYAADLALEALRAAGATSGLVDLGESSLGVFGTSLTMDVRDPEREDAPPWASFVVRDLSVSTSGGDQKPGHILDPHTGRPASGVASATVVAPRGIEADALSTGVYVLGAERGLRLLVRRGVDGIVLTGRGAHTVARATPGFATKFGLRLRPGVRLEYGGEGAPPVR